ncbi:MAG TPA: HDOD domain-containing protein [Syntrophorhabdaceae bacterium]|nr:HDOD domain-containing protein [Syntrophorhabdaceae bacterium]HOT41940.1 HDOD domain-containing protein [Syntrophorhabdaceae bacterium]HPP05724.1 HDOD domain-containing protein [Syntrophorhabdaceae bacterium]HQE79873.1 HDOD domain-containing protein [Syntrophorhabdaceae bacterium]HQH42274.1 HDOD domain-containing protein [Syntrophorhabdaceae bacterium]
MDIKDSVIEKLKKVDLLPTFPDLVSDVLRIIDDPMSSASDIARHMDASMVGEVLKVAGSAFFSRSGARKITSIEHAIAMIGYEHLTHIILQMPFLTLAKKDDKSIDLQGFLRHSTLCGVIAKDISTATLMGNPNEVYIASIIHDVGMVIIYRFFHEEWEAIMSLVNEKGISRIDAEREVLSFDHGVLGAMLMDMWDVPRSITDGVRYHHCPEQADENRDNAICVHLGNILSKQVIFNADSDSFVNFMVSNKGFVEKINKFRFPLSPKEEMELFSKIYSSLKGLGNIYRGNEDD